MKICKDCKYCEILTGCSDCCSYEIHVCNRFSESKRDIVSGEYTTTKLRRCWLRRSIFGKCGKKAKYFEKNGVS